MVGAGPEAPEWSDGGHIILAVSDESCRERQKAQSGTTGERFRMRITDYRLPISEAGNP
jgi:hypothetical protein